MNYPNFCKSIPKPNYDKKKDDDVDRNYGYTEKENSDHFQYFYYFSRKKKNTI